MTFEPSSLMASIGWPHDAPSLDPDDLHDDAVVLAAVDKLLTADRGYWRHTRAVVKAQLRLQEVSTEGAFQRYLAVEERVNAKLNFMLAKVMRWAFEEGRRNPSIRHRSDRSEEG